MSYAVLGLPRLSIFHRLQPLLGRPRLLYHLIPKTDCCFPATHPSASNISWTGLVNKSHTSSSPIVMRLAGLESLPTINHLNWNNKLNSIMIMTTHLWDVPKKISFSAHTTVTRILYSPAYTQAWLALLSNKTYIILPANTYIFSSWSVIQNN